jgi:hypothetical protein
MKTIRSALPLERLIKANAYAADSHVSICGLRHRIASCTLNSKAS